MSMWLIIMWTTLALTGVAWVYLSTRICRFGNIKKLTKNSEKRKAAIGGSVVFGLFTLIGLLLNYMNAIVCLIYFSLAWLISDGLFWLIEKLSGKTFTTYYAGITAMIIGTAALTAGWYAAHHVWQTDYALTTTKNIQPLKIVLFADAHFGTTFEADGFAKHLAKIQAQNPDVVVIAGDFVDDDTNREQMLAACRELGKLKATYGVYFVFGNHDKGYYGAARRGFSSADLIVELQKNGITTLRDEVVPIGKSAYLIGRRDASVSREMNGRRLSMDELTRDLDKRKYMIVADHQPNDYAAQAKSGVDLVLSGHTHGGQLWPFNRVGEWIGANDYTYGHEKQKNTDFIVTSGISAWAIKFKTGTKSEFAVITVNP